MNKLLQIMLLLGCIFSMNQLIAGTTITIKKSKINGNGTGNYNTVSREESSTTSAAGDVHIEINIGCADPGTTACPNAKPIAGGGLLESDVDPSVANYVETRMAEINTAIANGVLTAHDEKIVMITLANGTQKTYRVTEHWLCDANGDGEITFTIEEIS